MTIPTNENGQYTTAADAYEAFAQGEKDILGDMQPDPEFGFAGDPDGIDAYNSGGYADLARNIFDRCTPAVQRELKTPARLHG